MDNILARRFDWRHLIADGPESLGNIALLGADPGHHRLAVDTGLATESHDALPTEGHVDVAAVFAGHRADPRQVTAAVRDGGHIYWEIDRRQNPLQRPNVLIGQLEAAGATIVGVWTVRPNLDRPEAFIPIDEPHPFPWFLNNVYRSPRPLQRLMRRGVNALLRGDGRRAAAGSPLTVVVATMGDVDPDPSPLLMIHGGHRAIRILFERDATAPHRVVKIPREYAGDRTAHEQTMLHRARQIAGDDMADAIPRPLGFANLGEIDATIESALRGATVARRVTTSRANAEEDLSDAAAWLSDFHRRSLEMVTPEKKIIEKWFEEPFSRHAEIFGSDEDELLHDTVRRAEELQQQSPLPTVLRHGDFSVWNLLRTDDGIGVIDWEHANDGPPVVDLIQLCTHWHSHNGRYRPVVPDVDSFRGIFIDRRQTSRADRAVAGAFDHYLEALEIDDQWMPLLVVVNFVEIAHRRQQGRVGSGSELADPRRRNNGIGHLRVLADHLHRI